MVCAGEAVLSPAVYDGGHAQSSEAVEWTKILVPPDEVIKEVLQLTLEEAFFLQSTLGVLEIVDAGLSRALTGEETWRKFLNAKPKFVVTYSTYLHFRSKGWVPKCGVKFGGDFVLYRVGPQFYHAQYVMCGL